MSIEIKVPSAGESVAEGVLIAWHKRDGELVRAEDPLFELETDKITLQVPAEASGRLSITVQAGANVKIGQVVGALDTDAAAEALATPPPEPAPPGAQGPLPSEKGPLPSEKGPLPSEKGPLPSDETQRRRETRTPPPGEARPQKRGDARPWRLQGEQPVLPPSLRRWAREHGVDPAAIVASGPAGRPLPVDVLRSAPRPSSFGLPPSSTVPARAIDVAASASERETRRPMSSLRRRVAERLVQAQHQAAMLTTFNEVDLSAVQQLRGRHKDAFVARHGTKLGLMSFFTKAVVEALRSVPTLNARIEGGDIVEQHYYDIGVAVSTERGLVVPVLRDADRLSFAQIEQRLADLATRAAGGQLELSELQGGCFTISNGGIYGSMLSTPILNPPQSGILGMHAIKKRPVVVGTDDRLEVRPMMYLALSYDHRVVDGREAVTFLRRVVHCIEQPERLLLDV